MKTPFNLHQWIADNKALLQPPIGNQQIYKGNDDFIVMVVGGPNARKDYHISEGEELFYQLQGTIELWIQEDGKARMIEIKEGELFLLPARVPHSPRRPADTVGLVIERYRKEDEWDGCAWYCESCNHLLHTTRFPLKDIVQQLPKMMESFYASEQLRTCSVCGSVLSLPQPFVRK
ncbi:MAG: 3-hydroxyanthranilate 3,4-dioxygenase [Cytophagaceae bacterium]|jgi:3-hydroxyanthranilate 3,4-dioxygenase|nr:3-hydroxyanthranilate 3,4-dioxygenase [Cytophagaceae bacterium]